MQLIIFLIITAFIHNSLADFPTDIQRCKITDNGCIAKIITELMQNNPNGKSSMGLPKLEPLHVDNFEIIQGNSSVFSLQLKFRDVDIGGLSKVTVEKAGGFTEDANTSNFELTVQAPILTLKGKYSAAGRILVLPIQGDGNVDITMENVRIFAKHKPSVKKVNGKVHLGVNKSKLQTKPERVKIHLNNLFNGDRVLGDNMNTFMNENWRDIWTEVSPAVNSAIIKVVENILASIFKTITYEDFFIK